MDELLATISSGNTALSVATLEQIYRNSGKATEITGDRRLILESIFGKGKY